MRRQARSAIRGRRHRLLPGLRPYLEGAETTVTAEEPFRARIAFWLDGDEQTVVLDENLQPSVEE